MKSEEEQHLELCCEAMKKPHESYTSEDWSKLNGFDWATLLSEQPQFSNHCEWIKLDGFDWATLLSEQPQFAKHCDWSKFAGWDWRKLLIEQPQFAEHCDWSKLNEWDWSALIKKRAKLGINNKEAQCVLVSKYPDLFEKILPKNRDHDAQILYEMNKL